MRTPRLSPKEGAGPFGNGRPSALAVGKPGDSEPLLGYGYFVHKRDSARRVGYPVGVEAADPVSASCLLCFLELGVD